MLGATFAASTNGLAVILPAAAGALSLSWVAYCRARRGQLILAVGGGASVSTVAGVRGREQAWGAVNRTSIHRQPVWRGSLVCP